MEGYIYWDRNDNFPAWKSIKEVSMKKEKSIIILSRSPEVYFNRRMSSEAEARGILYRILNPLECLISPCEVLCKGAVIPPPSLCFLRTPPYREHREYFHAVARVFQACGVQVINPPSSTDISGDKILTKNRLQAEGIHIPRAMAVRRVEDLDYAVESVGGYPVFLKTFRGTRGIGVIFCPQRETLRAAAQTMWAYYANVFVEEFASPSGGATVRVLVCNDTALGTVKNEPANKDTLVENETEHLFRSNYSRGGDIEKYSLTPEMEELALSACRACGIVLGGVDLIETTEGWAVLEINSSPGIEGFESALSINAAGRILDILSEE